MDIDFGSGVGILIVGIFVSLRDLVEPLDSRFICCKVIGMIVYY